MRLELIYLNSAPVVAVNCDNRKAMGKKKWHKAKFKKWQHRVKGKKQQTKKKNHDKMEIKF